MRLVEKPWGFELIWAETEHYVGKMLHINPKQRLSLQYHNVKEETVYVTHGTLFNYTGDEGPPVQIPQGQSFHVKPHQVHRFAAGDEYVEFVEVSTPHLDDVVRMADDYKR